MSIIPYHSFVIVCVKEQSARSVHFSRGLASRSRSSVESVGISSFCAAETWYITVYCTVFRGLVLIQRQLSKIAFMFMNHHESSCTVQSSIIFNHLQHFHVMTRVSCQVQRLLRDTVQEAELQQLETRITLSHSKSQQV